MSGRNLLMVLWMVMLGPYNPPFRVEFTKPNNTATITQACLEIQCPSGIGECIVHRQSDRWPERTVVRFALHGLEHVLIQVGNRKWAGSVSSHDGSVRWTRRTDDGPEMSIEASDPDWCPIRIAGAEATEPIRVSIDDSARWELQLPEQWLADNPKSIRIAWIDFYR